MSFLDNIFGKKPTLKEQQRDNDRALRKAGRDVERDRRELEREEKKIEMEIKKLAAQGNREACKILAKHLVQLRKQKTRTYTANSKIASVGAQNKVLGANMKMAQVMETTGKTMKNMNNLVRPEQVAANMRDFSQASMKLDMTEEMINDTLDDILDDESDEEETSKIINQVLDEIGIEISGKMAEAPTAVKDKVSDTSKARLPTDEEIEEQLAKLRA